MARYGEYHTRRLVLEVWQQIQPVPVLDFLTENYEGTTSFSIDGSSRPAPVMIFDFPPEEHMKMRPARRAGMGGCYRQ